MDKWRQNLKKMLESRDELHDEPAFDIQGYMPPITVIEGQMETQLMDGILKAVRKYDISVDKDELIKALRYDRDQYDRAFADGYAVALNRLMAAGIISRFQAKLSIMEVANNG